VTFAQKLFSFEGRLRRRDFWLGVLIQWGILIAYYLVVTILAVALGVGAGALADPNAPVTGAAMVLMLVNGVLAVGLFAGLLWMGLAIQVKRCHDRNQSGWFVLFGIIPFFSLINLGILDGTPGANRFGPSPKHPASPSAEVFA
jgi:uncharacterized membrane protein YhaH (DUF805 family)